MELHLVRAGLWFKIVIPQGHRSKKFTKGI